MPQVKRLRLVKVSQWELTDQEQDDAAAGADVTDPERTAAPRILSLWVRTHHASQTEERDRIYMVLRR